MEPDRQEIYERIPWETLERTGNSRQWMTLAGAGAVVVGVLAYSFVSNQPVEIPPPEMVIASGQPTATLPLPSTPLTTVNTPIVVAEADLFAIHPERLVDMVSSHAEWFAVEYFTMDESAESRSTLQALLPQGLPMPTASPGTQVFVDWVGVQSVVETGALAYEVKVAVRSLVSDSQTGFVRQPTRLAVLDIALDGAGTPRVTGPPMVEILDYPDSPAMTIAPIPQALQQQAESTYGEVLGGSQQPDGSWRVVVLTEGIDGVTRPVTVTLP